MENKEKQRCQNCGVFMNPDDLKYVVEIRSFADYDGFIGEDPDMGFEEGINSFLDAMESMEVSDVEDITSDLILILCRKCRDNFMADPLQTGIQTFLGHDTKPILH